MTKKIEGSNFELVEFYKNSKKTEKCEHCGKSIKNVCVIKNNIGQVFHVGQTCFEKILEKNNIKTEEKKSLIWIIKETFDLLKDINKAKKIFYNDIYFILYFGKSDNIIKAFVHEFQKYKGINFEKLIKNSGKWYYHNSKDLYKKDSLMDLSDFMDIMT